MKQVLFIFFALQLLSLIVCAQIHDIKFEHLSTQQGLSHGIVNCIFQDQEGFMWFGTRDGLNKYDGYNFLLYDHDPNDTNSISSNLIQSIYEDRSGTLWIGTNAGLNKFNKATNTFTLYKHNAGDINNISDNNIQSIYEDRSGTLWIGTYEGLNKFNRADNSFTLYQHNPTGDNWIYNLIQAIYEDQSGTLWVGTNRGLSKFNLETKVFTLFYNNTQSTDSLHNFDSSVKTIQEDKYGTLWVGTIRDGLKEFDRKTNTFKVHTHQPVNPHSISNNNILSLFIDSFGVIWVGTQHGGLNRYDKITEKFTHYVHDPNHAGTISNNSIISIYEDRSKVLWIGTFSGGINKVDLLKKKFIHYKHNLLNNSIRDNFVYALYKDQLGAVWVGHRLGIDKLDRTTGQYTHYRYDRILPKDLSSNTAHYIYEDKLNNLWIGLNGGGLKKFDWKTNQFTTYLYNPSDGSSLPNNSVHEIYEDKAGALWIATLNGLSKFDRGKEIFTTYRPKILIKPRFDVTHIFEDETGKLWLATGMDGLTQFDPQTGIFIQHPYNAKNFKNPGGTYINCIYKDQSRVMWVGLTGGGLHQFDQKTSTFTAVTEPKVLTSIVINGIMEDKKGNLWLFTRKNGIYKYNILTKALRNYDVHDGLQGNEFNKAFCKGTNGEMYAGGNNGFNVFHPDSIRDNPYAPQVAINGFKVFDKPRGFSGKEIILPYSNNFFSFDFVALSYAMPEKNQYAYKLENFNKEWIQAGTRRYASYTNLDPGEYILRLKAANHDGVWNHKGVSINITITPPWWRTMWAYLLYGILFTGVLYILRYYTLSRERLKNSLKIKSIESAKFQELDSLKSQFFANISHEFRTPLTLIISPLEQMLSEASPRKEYNSMYRNAKRLLQLINQLLYITKLESGGIKLIYEPGEIIHFIKTYVASFTSLADSRQIKLNFYHDPKEIFTSFDQDTLEKIVYNLVSNAIKFTKENGEITISVALQADIKKNIEIKVEDTGIGIPADKINLIFNRFYQIDSSHTREFEGTGIGLSITKELVELHGGTIVVNSKEEEGTCFLVRLPFLEVNGEHHSIIKNSHVNLKEILDDNLVNYTSATEEPDIQKQSPIMLIVEDNADLRKYIQSMFVNSYHIYEAGNGIEGLKIALSVLPDVIISDVMMSGMDGIELVKKIKSDERTSHIPIILLTAKAVLENKLEGLETGADDYMVKPFHAGELTLRVNNLILQRKKIREHFSRVFNLQIPPDTIASVSKTSKPKVKLADETPALSLTVADDKFLKKVIDIIEKYIADTDFNVELLEKEVDMGHLQLYRKMKAITNQAPGEFIRKYRLKKAAIFLSHKEYSVSQVAYQVGFSNMSHFTKSFRQMYGLTPSEYAAQNSN